MAAGQDPGASECGYADSDLVRDAVAATKAGDPEACHFLYVRFVEEVEEALRDLGLGPEAVQRLATGIFSRMPAVIAGYEAGAWPSFGCRLLAHARQIGGAETPASGRAPSPSLPDPPATARALW